MAAFCPAVSPLSKTGSIVAISGVWVFLPVSISRMMAFSISQVARPTNPPPPATFTGMRSPSFTCLATSPRNAPRLLKNVPACSSSFTSEKATSFIWATARDTAFCASVSNPAFNAASASPASSLPLAWRTNASGERVVRIRPSFSSALFCASPVKISASCPDWARAFMILPDKSRALRLASTIPCSLSRLPGALT